jgi:glycogen debranching enzyme
VVFSKENTKYNTGDGTPLLIRAVYEYYLCTNDIDLVVELWDYLTLCIEEGFINSRNSRGLVINNDADDWMDARRMGQESYSPRGENQVEIQALWYTCLWGVSNLGREIAGTFSKSRDKILCFVNTYQKLARDFGDIIRSRFITEDTTIYFRYHKKRTVM